MSDNDNTKPEAALDPEARKKKLAADYRKLLQDDEGLQAATRLLPPEEGPAN